MAHGRECTFDWVRCAQMLPMLCREVVEGEQSIAVFGQAFDRLLVFNVVDFDERVECDESILLGPGHPDLLQCDPPSKWWTPLINSFGSRKVFDGYSASSIHGGIQAGGGWTAGEQRPAVEPDRPGAGDCRFEAACLEE